MNALHRAWYFFVLVLFAASGLVADDVTNTLRFEITDEAGHAVPCRIHLANADGEPVLAPDLPAWRDHFVCDGGVELELPPGLYHYEIERGPEHRRLVGDAELAETHTVEATLERVADLPALGWYAGDMHIHRRPEEAPLL